MCTDKAARSRSAVAAYRYSNQLLFLGVSQLRGYNSSLVDLPFSSFGVIVDQGKNRFIRVQVNTAGPEQPISFFNEPIRWKGREHRPGVRKQRQSTATSDVVVGVDASVGDGGMMADFYFVPTLLIERLNQDSISIDKVKNTKNNWECLDNCMSMQYVATEFADLIEPSS